MSSYSTIQQHQPLRIPAGWGTQERRLIAQLEEVLDDIYRRFGRLRWDDLGKALQQRFVSADGKVSQLEQTAEQFEIKLSELGTPEELINAILRIDHDGIYMQGGEVNMQTDTFAVTSLEDGEEMMHLDKQGLDAPLVSAQVIRSPSVVSVWTGTGELSFAGGINASLANLPPYLPRDVVLNIPAGTFAEDVIISGLTGPGKLTLQIGGETVVQGSISILSCACPVELLGGTLLATGTAAVRTSGCNNVQLTGMRLQGNMTGTVANGVECGNGNAYLSSCVLERMHHCIVAGINGRITCMDCSGGNAAGLYTPTANTGYGLYAQTGGSIMATGSTPAGMQGLSNVSLNTPGPATVFGDPVATGSDGTVIEPVVTMTLTSTDHGRLRIATDATSSAFTSSQPFQGRSFGYDNWGAWFFGSQLDALTGKVIRSAKLTITRSDAWGSEEAVEIQVYPHAWLTRPTATYTRNTLDNMFSSNVATMVLGRGESATVVLPDSVLTGLAEGSICGFAVTRQGSYAQLDGSCTLTLEIGE